jgi:ASC-1-like (ASCH) protein
MKLKPEPFSAIKLGIKSFELRLYDEKRRKISVGDIIEFTSTESGESLSRRVRALHLFESFSELYRTLPLDKCGYTSENISTASPKDMDIYYSSEEQKQYGVVAIELEAIEQ